QPRADTYNSLNTAPNERQHTLGLFRDGSIAVETTDGTAQKCRFEKYDGTSFQPFPAAPPECGANAFIETQNGTLWLGTDRGPFCYREGRWLTFTNATVPAPIVSFVETASGKLWCATPDAVWEYSAQTWSIVRSGFDQINNMIRAHDGIIWV